MTYSVLLMQIGSVILNYNRNKSKLNLMEQLFQQFSNIETNFKAIYIKPNEIQNSSRKWSDVNIIIVFFTKNVNSLKKEALHLN